MINRLCKRIFHISTKSFGSHSYIIKDDIIAIIDPGMITNFSNLKSELEKLGINVDDIKLIINTHEHIDHVSCNIKFKNALIATHKITAKRIEFSKRLLQLLGIKNRVDLKLEENSIIDLGKHKLRLIYTPGHSVGSCCFYEEKGKFLFSGDTVFAYGTPALITPSGSKKDYINSLNKLLKLNIKKILPGHGDISDNPKEDIKLTIKNI